MILEYEKQLKELTSKKPEKNLEKKITTLEKKIQKGKTALDKAIDNWREKGSERYAKPKPIFRELLLNPSYIIFINGFKYEEKIVNLMKNHYSEFPLYMGNSEFAANFKFIDCFSSEKIEIEKLDSFTIFPEKIKFEAGKKYTNMNAALRVTGKREYRDYKNVIVCNKKIMLSSPTTGYSLTTDMGAFNCEFI